MNGSYTAVLLWVINILLGIVIGLIGLILRQHKDHDDERIMEMKATIEHIRQQLEQQHH